MLQPTISKINSSERNIRGECELRSHFCERAWARETTAHPLTDSNIDFSSLMGLLMNEGGPAPSVCISMGQAAHNFTFNGTTHP